MSGITDLHNTWKHLYIDFLPALAKSRDPVQVSWPVHLHHCFARIILDNAVGVDRPWTEIVKQPAIVNMTLAQLEAAVELAELVATGETDLVVLNQRSLRLRGKKRKAEDAVQEMDRIHVEKRTSRTISSYFLPSASPAKNAGVSHEEEVIAKQSGTLDFDETESEDIDVAVQLKRISESNLTPFRKQMLSLLCQVPRGRYSTYQTLSDHISKTSHKTCARAVGNAMRNNPFAPEVPCHRILANDGTLGGFGGHWGESGEFASKKHALLYQEGVRFDSRGKVKGPPFRDFT